jgi:hypothetical protein
LHTRLAYIAKLIEVKALEIGLDQAAGGGAD